MFTVHVIVDSDDDANDGDDDDADVADDDDDVADDDAADIASLFPIQRLC